MRLAVGWAVIAVLTCGLASTASGQFSPGKLSRAHAKIDNPTSCLQCHAPRKTTTPDRCLACHTSLSARLTAGQGLHASLTPGKTPECGTCHAEHGGVDAALVTWPGKGPDAFDHTRAGFPLRGAHATLRCDQCHKPDMVRAADVRADHSLSLEHTFLGLPAQCSQCHTDPHRGQFETAMRKNDCAACHSETSWKNVNFDHATTRFPLTGQHAALQCAKCHFSFSPAGDRVAAGTAGSTVRYRPIESASCVSCHADQHRGQLGNACAQCHSTESWKRIGTAGFDHSRARFPLAGKHTSVDCAKCHYPQSAAGQRVAAGTPGSTMRFKPLAFAACTACHADPHRNQFGADCNRCHSVTGWNVIAAGSFDHDKTQYPLRGMHRPVACEKCHRNNDFTKHIVFDRCTACHRDAHGGELAKRPDKGSCEACHTVDGFQPAHFGLREHDSTRFPLREAHRAVACVACHTPHSVATETKPIARLHFTDVTCVTCHHDPHAGQFAVKGAATDCAKCHDNATWHLPQFDHGKTRFPLDGAHSRAACQACHRPVSAAGDGVIRYRPLDTACISCHAAAPRK